MFLCASANSQILLKQAQLEAVSSGNTDTLSTLAVLHSFVQERSVQSTSFSQVISKPAPSELSKSQPEVR